MSFSSLAKFVALFGLLATPSLAEDAPAPRFLVNGYPLGDARTYLDDSETRTYRRALAAFPNAAACLQDGNDATTSALNLEAFSNLEELEVCLFLTADALRDLERMRALLERSGFKTHGPIRYPESNMRFYGADGAGQAIEGTMSAAHVPFGLIGWLDRVFQVHGLSAQVLFGPNGSPVTTSASVIRL